MNNCSHRLIHKRMLRGMYAQSLLSLVLGVALWLCLYRIFLAQADTPPPPTDTLPYALYLPLIQAKPDAPPPSLSTIEWDPQLTERGAVLIGATITTGQGYWKLVKAEWLDEKEAGGRHHILIDMLDSAGKRVVNVPITIAWKDGATKIFSELKPGEIYAANYAMFDVAPSYAAQPATDAPADRVEGMGLGSLDLPTWKIHTSYALVWQWTIADSPPLTVTPTVTATLVVTPTPAISPTVALTLTVTPTPSVALTPVATIPTVAPLPTGATLTPVATITPTATPVPTPTPPSAPIAQAVVVGCQPNNQGSRFEGYVYRNGQLVNGDRIVFSYEADGPWVTQPAIAGTGTPGFYSHIISAGVARAGNWYAWLVDQNKQRISTIAAFTTNGEGGACNIASINFIH